MGNFLMVAVVMHTSSQSQQYFVSAQTNNFNTFVGDFSGEDTTSGSSNTMVGYNTGEELISETAGETSGGHYQRSPKSQHPNFSHHQQGHHGPGGGGGGGDNKFVGVRAGIVPSFFGTPSPTPEPTPGPTPTPSPNEAPTGADDDDSTDNTSVGAEDGEDVTTGVDNTFIGKKSGERVTTGSDNTCVGGNSCLSISEGRRNTAAGTNALGTGSTTRLIGDYNVAVGYESLFDLRKGSSGNTAVGAFAGMDLGPSSPSLEAVSCNTMVGRSAGVNSENVSFK